MVRSSSEVLSREHEDHVMFRQEQDEQLLLWMQRFVVVYNTSWEFMINYIL